uniref:RdRp n=1 Tax=Wenling partiti-like virus 2 TaxID=1923520 RepID=A0A1L3KLU9_9VIRU|nr:RdRp [Wenling partiti-like virus 2]
MPDCAAYMRAHVVKLGEQKVRAVWGYPATVSFMEACFALPLIEAYKEYSTPMAYGYETARGGVRRLIGELGNGTCFGCDYKDFDKTVPPWLIRIAFKILASNIDFRCYLHKGIPMSSKLYHAWKALIEYFIKTPIRLCNGERYKKNRGVASGSYFTQLVDSIVNWIVTVYCLRVQGLEPNKIKVLGDDSVVNVSHPVDIEKFSESADSLGMTVNQKKTDQADDCSKIKFLGYYLNTGIPRRPVEELWAALRFPERPDRSYDDFATRAMGLLVANFGKDTEFDLTCRECLKWPFKIKPNPSFTRFMAVLGIDVPLQAPSTFQLGLMCS